MNFQDFPYMSVSAYLQHIPWIEQTIRDNRLDSVVCGLGPTAWLLPWLDQSIVAPLRKWGVHDGFRIMPMDDLVIMDSPVINLHGDSGRYAHIVNARPKRLWVYENNMVTWKDKLAPCMAPVTQTVQWNVCRPDRVPRNIEKIPFKLDADPMHTTTISPTGTTTLAWREGCRRIGVIGVDCMKGHHHTHRHWPLIDVFFRKIADQAHALGGCVVNLSPITSLRGFREWKPPTSGLGPINTSTEQAPSLS